MARLDIHNYPSTAPQRYDQSVETTLAAPSSTAMFGESFHQDSRSEPMAVEKDAVRFLGLPELTP